MMHSSPASAKILDIWRIISKTITAESLVVRLIDGDPVIHFLSIFLKADPGILHELFYNIAVFPSAGFVDGFRQIIVIEGYQRFYMIFSAGVDDTVIKVNASLTLTTGTIWQNPGPCNRKAVSILTAFSQHTDVLFIVMIKIACHISGHRIDAVLLTVAEYIPVRKAFTAFLPAALALISGSGTAP